MVRNSKWKCMDLILVNDGLYQFSSCHKADDGTYVVVELISEIKLF